MENYSELIERCRNNEEEAIIKGAAMGAVILSRMGPIYERGSVSKFQKIAQRFSQELNDITTIEDFDIFHERFVESLQNEIKGQDGEKLSYGEAQKSINVFLKTYVDRSSRPRTLVAETIRPFLHVPLDSIMIKYFRKNFRSDYSIYIAPVHHQVNEWLRDTNPASTVKIPDRVLSELKYIFQEVYLAWQKWFRAIYPNKPVMLDTIWALERERN